MITALDTIETTINNRSDLLQNTRLIYALWRAKKRDYLKEHKNYFKALFAAQATSAYSEIYRSFQSYFSSYNEWLSPRHEYTWAFNANFDKIYQPINRSLVNRLFSERIVTTDANYHPEVGWLMPKESPMSALLSDLRDLMKEGGENEECGEDEYGALRPTIHAFRTALNLIIEASFLLMDGYPFGCASTDSEGGIRVEWFTTKGEIRLVIPASKEKEPYIYYEFGEKYGVDRQANADKLARWINRLTNI